MAMRTIGNLQGERPQGVSSGYPPRGIYQFLVNKVSSETSTNGFEFDKIEGTSVACYTPQDDGSWLADKSGVGVDVRTSISFPDGKSTEADKYRERELKGALLSVGVYGEYAAQAGMTLEAYLTSLADTIPFDVDWFMGQTLFVTFDPPPKGYKDPKTGKNGFPLITILTGGPDGGVENARAQFNKIATSGKNISWGYDTKMAKQAGGNAMAPTAAAGMLPPAGAPPAGPPAVGGPSAPGGPRPGGAAVAVAPAGPAPGGYAAPAAPQAAPPAAYAAPVAALPTGPAAPSNGLTPPGGPSAPVAPGRFGPPGQA
jgi:hypothetical protein